MMLGIITKAQGRMTGREHLLLIDREKGVLEIIDRQIDKYIDG